MRIVPKMMSTCGSKVRYLTFSRIRIYPRTKFQKIALEQGKIEENTNLLYPTYYESGPSTKLESLLPLMIRDSFRLASKIMGNSRPT